MIAYVSKDRYGNFVFHRYRWFNSDIEVLVNESFFDNWEEQ